MTAPFSKGDTVRHKVLHHRGEVIRVEVDKKRVRVYVRLSASRTVLFYADELELVKKGGKENG